MGADPDLSHVVLRSNLPLVADAPAGALYLWSNGALEPASRLPVDEGGAIVAASLGSQEGSVIHAISDDGSRLFWGSGYEGYGNPQSPFTGFYLRDAEADQSARLDVPAAGAGSGKVAPVFQGASADGTVVFFTDSQQLTADASPGGRDLYRCTVPAGAAAEGCASLTDISAPAAGPGERADVKDLLPGVSEDGTRAYFVAEGMLDDAPNKQGDTAIEGAPNLYFWQEGAGPRFIATLAPGDDADWGHFALGKTATMVAAASPDGRYFAFMSERALAGNDTIDARINEPAEEVYRYDAVTQELACASCDPSNAAPVATRLISPALDPHDIWENRLLGAVLAQPHGAEAVPGLAFHRPRTVLDDGRVFFNSFGPLVPGDSNGEWDVYQYESDGAGSCGAASGNAATARSGNGCVSLLSSGRAEGETVFIDASVSGNDVFFMTQGRLSAIDGGDAVDVYDARVNGVAATLPPRPAECLGEACQSAAEAPVDPTPASSSFSGAGNVSAHCPKGKRTVKRNGRARCVKRRHHKHKHRKSSHRRGAAR